MTAAEMNTHVRDNETFLYNRLLANFTGDPYVNLVSSSTETDLLGASGVTVPGGTLGTARQLLIHLWGDFWNNTGSNQTVTPKLYYGGTAIAGTGVSIASYTNRLLFQGDLQLAAAGATNDQKCGGYTNTMQTGANLFYIPAAQIGAESIAVDSTADQTLRLTATLSALNASLALRVYGIHVWVIGA